MDEAIKFHNSYHATLRVLFGEYDCGCTRRDFVLGWVWANVNITGVAELGGRGGHGHPDVLRMQRYLVDIVLSSLLPKVLDAHESFAIPIFLELAPPLH